MIFLYASKKMAQHQIETSHSKECEDVCVNFFQIICNSPQLMTQFCRTFSTDTHIPLSEKLFLSEFILSKCLPTAYSIQIKEQLTEGYWATNHVMDPHNYHGFSAEENLLYCFIASLDKCNQITDNYFGNITPLHYINPKIWPISFSAYPSPTVNAHAIAIYFILEKVIRTIDKTLHIHAPANFESLDIQQLTTPFGHLSLSLSKEEGAINVAFKHEFQASPTAILLHCPANYNSAHFADNKETFAIENHCIQLP